MAEHWLSDIANYLKVTNNVMNGSVFLYEMPENVMSGAMLIPPPRGLPIDPDVPGLYKGTFEVMVRSNHPKTSRDTLATVIIPLLTKGRDSTTWPNMHVNYCRPLNTPQVFPKSDGGFYEASVEFMISFTDSRI
jgi:hypothetical protein